MLLRTSKLSPAALLTLILFSSAWADDSRSAEIGDASINAPTPRIGLFRLVIDSRYATDEQIKKMMAPYTIVDTREISNNDGLVVYRVRIFYTGDASNLKGKLLRKDLPWSHPNRYIKRHILSLDQLADDSTWGLKPAPPVRHER